MLDRSSIITLILVFAIGPRTLAAQPADNGRLRTADSRAAVKIGLGAGGSSDGNQGSTQSATNAPSGVLGFELLSRPGDVQGGLFLDFFESMQTAARGSGSGPADRYRVFALQGGFTLHANLGRYFGR